MKFKFFGQKGFVFPPLVVLALVILGIGGLGTVGAANSARPGDLLFGLDQAIEELRVKVSGNEVSQAKVRLEIGQERLSELEGLLIANQTIDPAIIETQQAIANTTSALSNLEVKFKENKITISSADLQALLQELQKLLTTHQGLIRRVEIRIKDDGIRAKVKLFEQEASESAELVDDDLDDLEDDGQLNASIANVLEIELKGLLQKAGSLFLLTAGGKTYTLTAGSGVTLDDFAGKSVELKGTAQNATPTQVTVTRIKIEDDEGEAKVEVDDEDEFEVAGLPEVEARGFVRKAGTGFILTSNAKTLYTLSSTKINLGSFVDKFVKVEGTLSGNTLNVLEIEVRKTKNGQSVSPALSTSEPNGGDSDED